VIYTVNAYPPYPSEASVTDLVGDFIYGSNTLINEPYGIAVDSGGNIYVTNRGLTSGFNSVTVYPPLLAGAGTLNQAPTANITGSNTELSYPVGIALDSAGDIYVANQGNDEITVYPPVPSGVLTGNTTVTMNESPAANIPLDYFPEYVALDQNLNIYVTEFEGTQFQVFPPVPSADLTGNTNVTLSGTPTASINGVGLNGPLGIAVDTSGNIYVANEFNAPNESNATITIYPPLGSSTGTVNENPTATIGGLNPGLSGPYGLALDANGHLFVVNGFSPEAGTGNAVLVFPQLGSSIPAASNVTLNELPLAAINGPTYGVIDVAVQPPVLFPTTTPTPTATATPCASGICGQVLGGLTPISGSAVTLFASAGTGYGLGATLGTATTAGDGTFTVTSFTCPGGNPQTYITATGGNAGNGINGAIGLMAALGPCNSLSTSTNVTINELTTAAADWALAQFFDSTGHTIGAPSTNATGLQNAYMNLANLADVNPINLSVSGNQSSFLPPSPPGCSVQFPPPSCSGVNNDGLLRLNTLADILAGCIESSGSGSSACVKLLCDATPGFTYSGSACTGTPTITDTLGAAHLIVTNPANNVSALYGLAGTTPFSPTLGSAPDGWEMALNFDAAGFGLDVPVATALDASGNVFVASCGEVCGGNTSGRMAELTVSSGYTSVLSLGANEFDFNEPLSLALDTSGNLFGGNFAGNSVTELTVASSPPYSTAVGIAPSGASFNQPGSLALDPSGNLFAANEVFDAGSVSEVTAPAYSTGLNFAPTNAKFNYPNSLALDGSGNVFVTNAAGESVSELTAVSSYATGLNFAPVAAKFDDPGGIALDGPGNVFTLNGFGGTGDNGSVSELTATSSYSTGLNFDPAGAAFSEAGDLAVDGSGNVFVTNYGQFGGAGVSELTAGSSYGTGLNFNPAGAAFSLPGSIALDESGNVFVANEGGLVSEIMGLAKPVITPVQSCTIFRADNPGQACVP
jgi:hypothetical protein